MNEVLEYYVLLGILILKQKVLFPVTEININERLVNITNALSIIPKETLFSQLF